MGEVVPLNPRRYRCTRCSAAVDRPTGEVPPGWSPQALPKWNGDEWGGLCGPCCKHVDRLAAELELEINRRRARRKDRK